MTEAKGLLLGIGNVPREASRFREGEISIFTRPEGFEDASWKSELQEPGLLAGVIIHTEALCA
jgi:hypothetical protein